MLGWLLLVIVCLSEVLGGRVRNAIFKTETGGYVFVRHGRSVLDLPDVDTVRALGFAAENATLVPSDVLAMFIQEGTAPSLKMANQWPDEQMRVKIDKILIFDPAKYWIESHPLPGHSKEVGAFNPTIVKVANGRILMSWRSGDIDSKLQFGWYNMENHTAVEDTRMAVHNSVLISNRFPTMEDGRLIEVNNHTVAVIFGGKVGKFDMSYRGLKDDILMVSYGVLNPATGAYEFVGHGHTTQWMQYPESQKNWVPFVHSGHLLMFQSINPPHIVKLASKSANASVSEGDAQVAVVKTFHKGEPVRLPWAAEFGEHIKGGTPAIHVRGVLLSLFHTQSIFVQQFRTYFMGAVAFCPHFPFNIHLMSTVPIVQKGLYETGWANRFCNYVLFPMGLVVDEDQEHLWVSMGYQDKDGYVIKLDLDGLFDSMEIVSNCTAVSHPSE